MKGSIDNLKRTPILKMEIFTISPSWKIQNFSICNVAIFHSSLNAVVPDYDTKQFLEFLAVSESGW